MTRMLASVTGPDEAAIALAGGADIIDLKDPARGALGDVTPQVATATVQAVAGRRPVSAVAGEPLLRFDQLAERISALAACGVAYVKFGVFPEQEAAACIRSLSGLAAKVKLVAVLFADASPDLARVPLLLAQSGFAGAMLDTRGKATGRLLDHLPLSGLRGFIERCHTAGLIAGLAGSLEPPDIPRLLVLGPDLLGFRGALCGSGGRTATLELGCVRAVRGLIPAEGGGPETRSVDYRLLATRGYPPPVSGEDVPVDRVFVEDFVLPVSIGAYTREHAAPQRVRFAVDAWVTRTGRSAEDMRDVFSYDLITDAIRMLVDAGHIALVEALAERIAAMVLAHPRVIKVGVRVQKLETGLGTVGVDIQRTRTGVRAASSPVIALVTDVADGGANT